MALVEVDPISRIEGHLGIQLDVTDNEVTDANAHGNLWRGFENFLIGREPNDAITFTQRICGVCPLPHATASTFAVDSVLNYSTGYITFNDEDPDVYGVPAKAVHVRNLVYAAEFLMSHITHFYHLVALSYVQGPPIAPWTPYFADDTDGGALPADGWYHALLKLPAGRLVPNGTLLWDAVVRQYVKALRIRRLTFEAGALFAGRMPMTSSFVAGGVTLQDNATLFADKCDKFYALISEVGDFIVHEHVPLVLALGYLYPDYDNANNWGGGATNPGIGAGLGNFLAWGAFPNGETNVLTIAGGYKLASGDPVITITSKLGDESASGVPVTTAQAWIESSLVEDVAHSRYVPNEDWGYASAATWQYPGDVIRTEPVRDDADKYSWIKAPRMKVGSTYYAMEVGPFARMVVNGWYPVDGSMIALAVPTMVDIYVTGTAIDASMISTDLVNGLTNSTDAGTVAALLGYIYDLRGGLSTMDRLRARALESLVLVQAMIGNYDKPNDQFNNGTLDEMGGWIEAVKARAGESNYTSKQVPVVEKSGYGVSEAPRGALAHFITINQGKIAAYQCVVPTTWNASPKDSQDGNFDTANSGRGPIEQACFGAPYAGGSTPGVEALRIAQSFDPCIACAVH